jgi:hypothetical protein
MILKEQFKKLNYHWGREEKYKREIAAKQEKLKKLENSKKSSWIDTLLHPLAVEIAAKIGRSKWEVMGPFGLGCETSIHFWDTPEQRKECNVDSLTFRPDLHFYEGRETNPFGVQVKGKKNTKTFKAGSIGELNGGNYPSIVPPADADLDWFIKHISWAKGRKRPVK